MKTLLVGTKGMVHGWSDASSPHRTHCGLRVRGATMRVYVGEQSTDLVTCPRCRYKLSPGDASVKAKCAAQRLVDKAGIAWSNDGRVPGSWAWARALLACADGYGVAIRRGLRKATVAELRALGARLVVEAKSRDEEIAEAARVAIKRARDERWITPRMRAGSHVWVSLAYSCWVPTERVPMCVRGKVLDAIRREAMRCS
jgi:hypothetical protein